MALSACLALARWSRQSVAALHHRALDVQRRELVIKRCEQRREIDRLRLAAYGPLWIEVEERPHAAVALGAGAQGQQRAVLVRVGFGQRHQRFEIGLALLALLLRVRQRALEQAQQRAGGAAGRTEHAQMQLVVGNHVEEGFDAHQPAGRTHMQRPAGAGGRREIERAALFEYDRHAARHLHRPHPTMRRDRAGRGSV